MTSRNWAKAEDCELTSSPAEAYLLTTLGDNTPDDMIYRGDLDTIFKRVRLSPEQGQKTLLELQKKGVITLLKDGGIFLNI